MIAILLRVCHIELIKLMKSPVFWITACLFTIAPLMASFFMFVLQHPDLASQVGLLGQKAQIAGEASWPAFIVLHAQIIAVGGIIVYGFLTSWIFGREYYDKTMLDLFILPYSRAIIVSAKFVVLLMMNVLLTVYILGVGFALGILLTLPQFSWPTITDGFIYLLFIALLTILLSAPVAFFATVSKGYLAPLGFIIIILILSQIVTAAGAGEYFPWAIPALLSGITEDSSAISIGQFISVSAVCLAGMFGTILQVLYADYH